MGRFVFVRVTKLVASVSLMGVAATAMGTEPVPRGGAIVSETRTLTTADGVTVNYEIGTFYVPENRHKAKSRPIGVGFACIRAPRPTGASPVFWLPGGRCSAPIENALEVLPYYSHGHAIVVHRGGHDGTFYLLREEAKAKAAIYAFMRTGSLEGLPSGVTLPLPTFVKPAFAANDL